MRVRRSILLGVAFGSLLLIIGASAFAIWRNATAAQLRVAALHSTHLEAGNALATVRANVYLAGILTRDYLLDADPKQAPQYADQFLKIRMGTDDSFRVLAASAQSDQEKAALQRLRLEVATQLDPTRIILELTLAGNNPRRAEFLGERLRRRDQIVALANQVERMMTENFARERQRITKADEDFRASLAWTTGLALVLGFGIAGITLMRMVSLERQSQIAEVGIAAVIDASADFPGAGAEISVARIARSGRPDAHRSPHGVVEYRSNARRASERDSAADRTRDADGGGDAAHGSQYRHVAAALHARRSGSDSSPGVAGPGDLAIERHGDRG